jgi:4-amino-4-deoxy-L-arabinose transferase-like glycosyltransferase
MLRLPATIFGILTVWGVYLLTARLFSVRVGLLASFFVATSFWHINFSRIGLRAIGAPLFAVWGIYLLLAGLERARNGRPYLVTMIACGTVYALGFYTYIAYRITPMLVGFAALYYFFYARREKWMRAFGKAIAAFAVTAVVVVAPLVAYFVRNLETLTHRSAEVSIFHDARPIVSLFQNIFKTTQMVFTRGDFDWMHNISFRPVVFWPVALLFALGIVLAIRAFRPPEEWFANAMAILWLVAGAVPAVLSNEAMPNSLRSILMIPAIYTLAAIGAWFAYDCLARFIPKQWLPALGAALLLVVAYTGYRSYFHDWAENPKVPETFNSGGVEIVNRVNALPKTAPKYIVVVEPGAPEDQSIGVPIPVQTIMFMTASYTRKQQAETNIHYVYREPGDGLNGVPFCQAVAARVQAATFCFEVNRASRPVF